MELYHQHIQQDQLQQLVLLAVLMTSAADMRSAT